MKEQRLLALLRLKQSLHFCYNADPPGARRGIEKRLREYPGEAGGYHLFVESVFLRRDRPASHHR
jgi:hypothetical protein